MESYKAADLKRFFDVMSDLVQENKDLLTKLDSELGDGDLGITMTKGFGKAAVDLKDFDETDVGKLLVKGGMVIASAAPSTMGTLIATGFMRGGKAVTGKDIIGLEGLVDVLDSFVSGIMDRGKAKPGDKTIIDSLKPAADALKGASESGEDLVKGVEMACMAAEAGVESTKSMKSQHGRAAWFGDKSLGKQDPGAMVGLLILKALVISTK
jgi:dihydroxyacetone kinase-like protein